MSVWLIPPRAPAEGQRSPPWTGRVCGTHDQCRIRRHCLGVQIHQETFDDFPRLRPGRVLQLDIETVRLRIIAQLHGTSSRKFRLKKALLDTML